MKFERISSRWGVFNPLLARRAAYITSPMVGKKPSDQGVADAYVVATAGTIITYQYNGTYQSRPYQVTGAQFLIPTFTEIYTGLYPNGEQSGYWTEATLLVRAAIYISGVWYPLKFKSQQQATVPVGTPLFSDPLTVTLPTSGVYTRIEYTTTVNNQAVPLIAGYGAGSGAEVNDADAVYRAGLTWTDAAINSRVTFPLSVYGTPVSAPAIFTSNWTVCFGDSIANIMNPGLVAAGVAYWNQGVSGHELYDYYERPTVYMAVLDYAIGQAPVTVCQRGINDLRAGRNFASLQTSLITYATRRKYFGCKRLIILTLTPLTTSTDSWATLANQSYFANEADRVAYNNYVRGLTSLAGLQVSVVDVDAYVDAASGVTGKWPVGWTIDGVHPSGTQTISTGISADLAAKIVAPLS